MGFTTENLIINSQSPVSCREVKVLSRSTRPYQFLSSGSMAVLLIGFGRANCWQFTTGKKAEKSTVSYQNWKDSSLVTFMSTALDGTNNVKSLRKRPKQGKKKEEQKHKPFKGQPNAELEIPDITDGYNNNMGYVDGFDHLTAMNSGLRRVRKDAWQALEHWLLRGVLVNTYVIGQIWRREEELAKLRSQPEWREAIIEGLIEASKTTAMSTPVHPKDAISHRKRALPDDFGRDDYLVVRMKQNNCQYYGGLRKWDRPTKRVPLGI